MDFKYFWTGNRAVKGNDIIGQFFQGTGSLLTAAVTDPRLSAFTAQPWWGLFLRSHRCQGPLGINYYVRYKTKCECIPQRVFIQFFSGLLLCYCTSVCIAIFRAPHMDTCWLWKAHFVIQYKTIPFIPPPPGNSIYKALNRSNIYKHWADTTSSLLLSLSLSVSLLIVLSVSFALQLSDPPVSVVEGEKSVLLSTAPWGNNSNWILDARPTCSSAASSCNLQQQLVIRTFGMYWIGCRMTNHECIPKKRGMDQELLSGRAGFIPLLEYWVLPQHCFLVLLSSPQLSKTSKHGKSALPGNWKSGDPGASCQNKQIPKCCLICFVRLRKKPKNEQSTAASTHRSLTVFGVVALESLLNTGRKK